MFDAKKLLDAFVVAGQQMSAGASQNQTAGGGGAQSLGDGGSGGLAGQLGGLLDQIKGALGQSNTPNQGQGAGAPGLPGGLGDLGNILGQVLGQATSGVKQAANQANQATGASDALSEALRKFTGGQGTDELLAKAKELMQQNKMGTGAVLGGLAAVLLGTHAGRATLGTAARLGGIALIGGLAYKAVQNYQAGKPIIAGMGGAAGEAPEAAPQGSGFEPAAVTHEAALGFLRAMIAAASADGVIDDTERAKIVGAFNQTGMDKEATHFLEREFAHPASLDELAAEASTPELAVQMYTAARLVIDTTEAHNQRFLQQLAGALGLDANLVGHVEAQAKAAA